MKCVTCIHFELCAYASHQLPFGCDLYKEPVRHGRWEEYQVPHIVCCSECDWGTGVQDKYNYCPNCGAKMDALTLEEASRKLGQQAAETLKKLKEEGHDTQG